MVTTIGPAPGSNWLRAVVAQHGLQASADDWQRRVPERALAIRHTCPMLGFVCEWCKSDLTPDDRPSPRIQLPEPRSREVEYYDASVRATQSPVAPADDESGTIRQPGAYKVRTANWALAHGLPAIRTHPEPSRTPEGRRARHVRDKADRLHITTREADEMTPRRKRR